MSRIYIDNPLTRLNYQSDFETLIALIKGTSIVSLADSDSFLELGLSERLMLRIQPGERGTLRVTVFSTLNADEVPPVRLQLIAEGEEASAATVETRLHSLRQVYASMVLLNSGRGEELAAALRADPNTDLEQNLLHDKDRLYLEAAGPGSWFITAWTQVRKAPQKALNALSLVFGQGRDMLIERVRADTELKKEEVEAKRIANEAARRKLWFDTVKQLEKIKNPDDQELVRRLLLSNTNSANPKVSGPIIAGLLPPPKPKNP
jgi:hypothetical protein